MNETSFGFFTLRMPQQQAVNIYVYLELYHTIDCLLIISAFDVILYEKSSTH